MSGPTIHTVILGDELPAVGSGHRRVLARIGHKWVYVESADRPVECNFSRITRKQWDTIVRNTETVNARTQRAVAFREKHGRYPKRSISE